MNRLPSRFALGVCALLAVQAQAGDNTFIDEAMSAGMAEIQTSQLALEKSDAADVKAFARLMIKDHTQSNQQLLELAKKHDLPAPNDAALADKARKLMLQVQDGASFNAAYASHQVDAHEQAIRLFDEQRQSTSAPADLRNFATNALPALQHHLQEAKKLENEYRAAE